MHSPLIRPELKLSWLCIVCGTDYANKLRLQTRFCVNKLFICSVVIQNVIKCIADQKWHELDYAQKTDYQSFKRIREELSVVNGLLLRDERIVVPESLREREQ